MSESNKDTADDKFNRVNLKPRLDGDEIVILEVETARDGAFLQRVLYGTSKVVTEHLNEGDEYRRIPLVISVNVLFSPFRDGPDYVLHDRPRFDGLRMGEPMTLRAGLVGRPPSVELSRPS